MTAEASSSKGQAEYVLRLPSARLLPLTKALAAVEVIGDPVRRRVVIELLREEFPGEFDSPTFNTVNLDVLQMLRTCIKLDGVRTLLEVLSLVGGETREWQRLAELVNEQFPPGRLSQIQRDTLRRLLSTVPVQAVAPAIRLAGLQDLFVVPSPEGVNALTAFDLVLDQWVAGSIDELAFWKLLESIAHVADALSSQELHTAVLEITVRQGTLDRVREVCRDVTAALRVTAPAPYDHPAGDHDLGDNTIKNPDILGHARVGAIDVELGAENMNRVAVSPYVSVRVPAVMRGLPQRNAFFAGHGST